MFALIPWPLALFRYGRRIFNINMYIFFSFLLVGFCDCKLYLMKFRALFLMDFDILTVIYAALANERVKVMCGLCAKRQHHISPYHHITYSGEEIPISIITGLKLVLTWSTKYGRFLLTYLSGKQGHLLIALQIFERENCSRYVKNMLIFLFFLFAFFAFEYILLLVFISFY